MPDTNEEQLLSDLLGSIAREDAELDVPHLESRVMESAFASASARPTPPSFGETGSRYLIMAAAVVIAVGVPILSWIKPAPSNDRARIATEAIIPKKPENPAIEARINHSVPTRPTPASRPTQPSRPTRPTRPTPPVETVEEFVPLMPMTEQEIRGPFQLVRVQMPRASLGALRSPLEHPNELVEADVLLGQDGMARAIRVSTSGSVYPWRSR